MQGSNKARLVVELPRSVKRSLETAAKKREVTMTMIIRDLLEKWLTEQKQIKN